MPTIILTPEQRAQAEIEWRRRQREREVSVVLPRPHPGPQSDFLQCDADIVIFGGAAGGGKTWSLFFEGVKDRNHAGMRWVYFRREQTDIAKAGGPWDKSMLFFPLFGGRPNLTHHKWIFPSGAEGQFAALQYEHDVLGWQTAEIPLILFDELTHFTASQFFYMLSRNRATGVQGVKRRVRAGTNPDAGSWVKELIAPWVDKRFEGPRADDGEVRWFVRLDDKIVWVDKDYRAPLSSLGPDAENMDVETLEAMRRPKSIAFIRSRVYDNPALIKEDPEYIANLLSQDVVQKARLLDGDWDVSSGNFFDTFIVEGPDSHVIAPLYRPTTAPGYDEARDRPPAWFFYQGANDWGYSDPYAFVLGCWDELGCAHILESERVERLTDPEQAARVLAMLTRWGVDRQRCLIVGAADMYNNTQNGMPVIPHVQAYWEAGLNVAQGSNHPSVITAENAIIRRYLAISGKLKIYRAYNTDLISSLQNAKIDPKDPEHIAHDMNSHLVRALGALLASYPDVGVQPVPERPKEEITAEMNDDFRRADLERRDARMGARMNGKTKTPLGLL